MNGDKHANAEKQKGNIYSEKNVSFIDALMAAIIFTFNNSKPLIAISLVRPDDRLGVPLLDV